MIVAYFLFQVLVIVASSQIAAVDVSVIQWLGNFAGLCLFSGAVLMRHYMIKRNIFVLALYNIIIQMIPLVFYGEHLFDSLKSLGLNVNIVATFIYFLVWGAMYNARILTTDVEKILQTILSISAVVSMLAMAMDGSRLGYLFVNVNAYTIDFSGVFPNKNMLGSFLAVGLMAGIYLLHVREKKGFVLLQCVVVAMVLIFTLSRAAILTAVVFSVVFLLRRAHASFHSEENGFLKNYARRIRVFVLLGGLACVLLYLKSDTIQQFVITKVIRSAVGTAGRDTIWKNIVSSFDDNGIFHLFGMGYSELDFRSMEDCHNIYLYIYATGGLVKACIYAILLCKAFRNIFQLKQKSVVLADFSFSVAIAYLALGMFETNLLFELGLVNFTYTLFVLFIPTMYGMAEKSNGGMICYE